MIIIKTVQQNDQLSYSAQFISKSLRKQKSKNICLSTKTNGRFMFEGSFTLHQPLKIYDDHRRQTSTKGAAEYWTKTGTVSVLFWEAI